MKLITPQYRVAIGTFIILNAIVMIWLDMFSEYIANPTMVTALIGLGSTLIGAGLLKRKEQQG